MKKDIPLLLLLPCLNINGQKRNNSGTKSYLLLYLMNTDEKIRYIRNTVKWIAEAETLSDNYKKTELLPNQPFNSTKLNKTGRLKPLALPSRLKLIIIFGRCVLSGLLPKIPVTFAWNSSSYSVSSTVEYS